MNSKHQNYIVLESSFIGERKDIYVRQPNLPADIYDASWDNRTDLVTFTKIDLN